jgi:hypothetical protein
MKPVYAFPEEYRQIVRRQQELQIDGLSEFRDRDVLMYRNRTNTGP